MAVSATGVLKVQIASNKYHSLYSITFGWFQTNQEEWCGVKIPRGSPIIIEGNVFFLIVTGTPDPEKIKLQEHLFKVAFYENITFQELRNNPNLPCAKVFAAFTKKSNGTVELLPRRSAA